MFNKYLIINGLPILFSNEKQHADMVSETTIVESAGFFVIIGAKNNQKGKVVCLGESTTLSISSRPEIDQKIISAFLGLN